MSVKKYPARPEGDSLLKKRARAGLPLDRERCRACGGSRYWISREGVRVCSRCHPPASAAIVAEESLGEAECPHCEGVGYTEGVICEWCGGEGEGAQEEEP